MLKPEVNSGIKLSSSTATGARFLPSIVYFSGLMNYPQGTKHIHKDKYPNYWCWFQHSGCLYSGSSSKESTTWDACLEPRLVFFCLTTSNRFDTSKSLKYIFKDFVMEENNIRSSITSVLITWPNMIMINHISYQIVSYIYIEEESHCFNNISSVHMICYKRILYYIIFYYTSFYHNNMTILIKCGVS